MTTATQQQPEAATTPAEEKIEVAREIRLDHIGFVEELDKRFVKPLRDKVKAALMGKGVIHGAGDYFTGQIAGIGCSTREIDPQQFLRACERKKIPKAQIFAALKVTGKEALKCLSQNEIDKISVFTPATPRLTVERIKTVELPLVNCVKGLGEIIS